MRKIRKNVKINEENLFLTNFFVRNGQFLSACCSSVSKDPAAIC